MDDVRNRESNDDTAAHRNPHRPGGAPRAPTACARGGRVKRPRPRRFTGQLAAHVSHLSCRRAASPARPGPTPRLPYSRVAFHPPRPLDVLYWRSSPRNISRHQVSSLSAIAGGLTRALCVSSNSHADAPRPSRSIRRSCACWCAGVHNPPCAELPPIRHPAASVSRGGELSEGVWSRV